MGRPRHIGSALDLYSRAGGITDWYGEAINELLPAITAWGFFARALHQLVDHPGPRRAMSRTRRSSYEGTWMSLYGQLNIARNTIVTYFRLPPRPRAQKVQCVSKKIL